MVGDLGVRVRGECGGDCGVTRRGRCSAGKAEEGDGTAMRARAVSGRSARGVGGESDARQAGRRGVKRWLRREAGRCGAERWTGPGACCYGPQGRERAHAGLVWVVGPRCARLRLWGFGLG